MNKIVLICTREYLKIVRKPTFWLATLFFPVLMIAISLISGLSAEQAEKKIKEETENAKLIYIVDRSHEIADRYDQAPFVKTDDLDASIAAVKQGTADAVFVYPADVLDVRKIDVYARSKGILTDTGYGPMATEILKQSILAKIGDDRKIKAYSASYRTEVRVYENGLEITRSFEDFIVPGATVIAYFIMMIFGISYLLMSVSEEKENRMIETILSVVKPRELIWGKIAGQIGVILTQFTVLVGFAALGFTALRLKLPFDIDFSAVQVEPLQVLTGVWYLVCGFMIMANTMVGVGSVMPSYKEANSFASVFIMLSIFPIYFVTMILSDPTGLVARITSYFPFSAAMVLLFRSALDALPLWEIILSSVLLLGYVIGTFFLSYKLFEIGSLEYRNKISFAQLIRKQRSSK